MDDELVLNCIYVVLMKVILVYFSVCSNYLIVSVTYSISAGQGGDLLMEGLALVVIIW